MKIGVLSVDSRYPNLALMKICRFHRNNGDHVEWYDPFVRYDMVYQSKVFTFTEDYGYYINADHVEKGGTGYDISKKLPYHIDRMQPDYSLYPSSVIDSKTAYGFLTRGCPNKCKWCIVPVKEGMTTPYMDVEEIAVDGRSNLVLMDNNILSSDYGISQIEKIVSLKLRVDFNQGLDARLVTDDIAHLLAKTRWIRYVRFGCDTPAQIEYCENACGMMDKHGFKGEYFFYCLLNNDFNESYSRVNHWKKKGKRYSPFCQPFRSLTERNAIPQWQKDMAAWADKKWIFRTCDFKDFEPRKGFRCSYYFDNH